MKIVFFILLTFCVISAETKLSGKIQDMTLFVAESPYIVTDNVIVPQGKTLVITEGCVLLFKPYTGITVEGSLIVQGNPVNRVIFTSENDTKYNNNATQFPNPFDWNGILINPQATEVNLADCSIKYSVYGLKSLKTDITIENGLFNHNGQSNLSINEIMKNVADDVPYNYKLQSTPNNQEDTLNNPSGISTEENNLSSAKKTNPISPKKIVAIGCLGAGSVCLATTMYFLSQAFINHHQYSIAVEQPEIDKYKARRNSSVTYSYTCAIPTVLFASGATVFFKLHSNEKHQQQNASLLPQIGDLNGVTFSMEF